MALTIKKLDKIEKSLEGVFDADQFVEVQKQLAGVRAAIEAGETFTKADLNEMLGGEIEITPVPEPVVKGTEPVDETHPLQPVFMDLYKALIDETGAIRKGVTGPRMQELFEAAYQKGAGEFDTAIDTTVEATAIELGKGNKLIFGKSGGKGKDKPAPASGNGDEDGDDMAKMLKGVPGGAIILKTLTDLQSQVTLLKGERDVTVFTKQAADIGEPATFAADLQKLHHFDPALAASISKRLGAKNALLVKSQVWGAELGADGQGTGDGSTALEKMNALAKERVSKSAGKLTLAKAFTQVCGEQPDLYQEYENDRRSRQG